MITIFDSSLCWLFQFFSVHAFANTRLMCNAYVISYMRFVLTVYMIYKHQALISAGHAGHIGKNAPVGGQHLFFMNVKVHKLKQVFKQ